MLLNLTNWNATMISFDRPTSSRVPDNGSGFKFRVPGAKKLYPSLAYCVLNVHRMDGTPPVTEISFQMLSVLLGVLNHGHQCSAKHD